MEGERISAGGFRKIRGDQAGGCHRRKKVVRRFWGASGGTDFKNVERLKDRILGVKTAWYPEDIGYGDDAAYWDNETDDQASERGERCRAATTHFVEQSWQRANDLFEDPKNWHAVEALAAALLSDPERTMLGNRASKIVRKALETSPLNI